MLSDPPSRLSLCVGGASVHLPELPVMISTISRDVSVVTAVFVFSRNSWALPFEEAAREYLPEWMFLCERRESISGPKVYEYTARNQSDMNECYTLGYSRAMALNGLIARKRGHRMPPHTILRCVLVPHRCYFKQAQHVRYIC